MLDFSHLSTGAKLIILEEKPNNKTSSIWRQRKTDSEETMLYLLVSYLDLKMKAILDKTTK